MKSVTLEIVHGTVISDGKPMKATLSIPYVKGLDENGPGNAGLQRE